MKKATPAMKVVRTMATMMPIVMFVSREGFPVNWRLRGTPGGVVWGMYIVGLVEVGGLSRGGFEVRGGCV